jgi:hypothetical protein
LNLDEWVLFWAQFGHTIVEIEQYIQELISVSNKADLIFRPNEAKVLSENPPGAVAFKGAGLEPVPTDSGLPLDFESFPRNLGNPTQYNAVQVRP